MSSQSDGKWIQFLINLSMDIDGRVSNSNKHSTQVAQWSRSTARCLALPEEDVNRLYWAALLHDIGKVGVPNDVLTKRGPLNEREWVMMKLHPTVGANIVKSSITLAHIAPVIYAHQEKYDGSGYPEGLEGEAIPLEARILAVVDAYDAMTNDRVYRCARSHEDAVQELKSQVGQHFDPCVVDTFLEIVAT